MKLYLVLSARKAMEIVPPFSDKPIRVTLPEGEWFAPVYSDEAKAIEMAGSPEGVITLTINEDHQ